VMVKYGPNRRRFSLVRGEVYFELKHDVRRPVQVFADDRRVTMLGTKFVIREDADHLIVTVTEGRVRVDALGASANQQPTLLSADQVLAASGRSTVVTEDSPQKIAELLSWRSDRLIFHQMTLGDVAEEFNRYNEQQIVVENSASQIKISGGFDPKNAETFANLLHDGFGLKVESKGDRIFISE
jgi:transmembrane sensor